MYKAINHSVSSPNLHQGLPSGNATRSFAADLIDRVARPGSKRSGASSHRQQETQAAALAARNAQYGLLLDDEDDEDVDGGREKGKPADGGKKKKKEKALRKKDKVWGWSGWWVEGVGG